jgi:hypothetical protein
MVMVVAWRVGAARLKARDAVPGAALTKRRRSAAAALRRKAVLAGVPMRSRFLRWAFVQRGRHH